MRLPCALALSLIACGSESTSDPDAMPPPATAAQLEAKASGCTTGSLKGGFGLDGGGGISIYACGSAAVWTADMDVDCDGIQTPRTPRSARPLRPRGSRSNGQNTNCTPASNVSDAL